LRLEAALAKIAMMHSQIRFSLCLLIAVSLSFLYMVGAATRPSLNSTSPSPLQAPVGRRFTTADLRKLRWIEGTWRGTGDVEKPFFERYKFENDSTLAVDSFADDETLSKVKETTRFELKDGQFGNGGEDSRWAATSIDENSIAFAPVAKARNSFRFQRESKDSWKAILNWPATADKPARERVYHMERWPPLKP
jgi:hypothetical protein